MQSNYEVIVLKFDSDLNLINISKYRNYLISLKGFFEIHLYFI